MIVHADKSNCCGCSACAAACPYDAIMMSPDGMGFYYPQIDTNKCVNCGICEKICSFNDKYTSHIDISNQQIVGARHKDLHEVLTSRSGAAFVALSDAILAMGGSVYGAAFDPNFRVIHKRANTKEERDAFKGSKYVQSDIGECFKEIKKELKQGRLVLFSGTPCQNDGLSSYIGNVLKENLILVDIVCHGVPSPYIWRDYLKWVEQTYGGKVTAVDFRDKSELGWSAHKESFTFGSKKIYRTSYTYLFYEHIMLRPSCGVCHYTKLERPSDITLADFWGWEKMDLKINKDDHGVSLVFVNTPKGKRIFDQVKHNLDIIPVKISQCMQPNLQHPSILHPKYKAFEQDYIEKGFEFVAKRYGDMGWRYFFTRLRQKSRTAIRLIMRFGRH